MTHSVPKYGRPKHFPKGFCFSHTSRQIFLDGSSGRFVLLPNRTCGRETVAVALSDPTAGMDSNLLIVPANMIQHISSPSMCHEGQTCSFLLKFVTSQTSHSNRSFSTQKKPSVVSFSSFSHSPVIITVIPGPAPPAPRIPI